MMERILWRRGRRGQTALETNGHTAQCVHKHGSRSSGMGGQDVARPPMMESATHTPHRATFVHVRRRKTSPS